MKFFKILFLLILSLTFSHAATAAGNLLDSIQKSGEIKTRRFHHATLGNCSTETAN